MRGLLSTSRPANSCLGRNLTQILGIVHDRLIELAELGHTREIRMTLVSQELGHIRAALHQTDG